MQVPGQGKGLVNKVYRRDTGHGAHGLAPQFVQHALVVCRDALLPGKSAPGVD